MFESSITFDTINSKQSILTSPYIKKKYLKIAFFLPIIVEFPVLLIKSQKIKKKMIKKVFTLIKSFNQDHVRGGKKDNLLNIIKSDF